MIKIRAIRLSIGWGPIYSYDGIYQLKDNNWILLNDSIPENWSKYAVFCMIEKFTPSFIIKTGWNTGSITCFLKQDSDFNIPYSKESLEELLR